MAEFDPWTFIQSRLDRSVCEFEWSPGVAAEWKEALRGRLAVATGFDRLVEAPLAAQTLGESSQPGYSQRRVTFQSQPGLYVVGELLVPTGASGALPAVVCVPGHGPGVAPIVDESDPDYQCAFAVQCVRAGFLVLAVEQLGFGARRSKPGQTKDWSCSRDSMAALALGETMIAWRCFDALAGIRYLEGLPNVDPGRIAIMGISGGGTTAFWTACLSERVAACVVSGYFNTFRGSVLSIDHCVDNYVPGIAGVVDMPDMTALIAPRPLFVESGSDDEIFPMSSFESACARAFEVYADAKGQFGAHLFTGGHRFDGSQAIPWLARRLGLSG